MRTFIALRLSSDFKRGLAEVSRQLSSIMPGRFLPRENYHVTLAFLGEVDEAGARCAMDALDEACADARPIRLVPAGLGHFGRVQDATLWLGLERDPALMELAEGVRRSLRAHGLSIDEKPYRPHVTIARRVRLSRGQLPALPFPAPVVAERAALYRSFLDSSGATYKELYGVDLSG